MNMKVRRVELFHTCAQSHFALVLLEISGFQQGLLYVLLRTSADVATRPWRSPHLRVAVPGPVCTQECVKERLADIIL